MPLTLDIVSAQALGFACVLGWRGRGLCNTWTRCPAVPFAGPAGGFFTHMITHTHTHTHMHAHTYAQTRTHTHTHTNAIALVEMNGRRHTHTLCEENQNHDEHVQ